VANPLNSRPESSGLYILRERESREDLEQLYRHDESITVSMGGVLPEQPDLTEVERVLDVGCGTGSWLIDTARTYPTFSKLVGIDKNERAIEYAHAQASAQGLNDRVQFRVMDAQRVLALPPRSFDLTNQRLGGSYLRTWDWPLLLGELRRVTRVGGIIRITEADMVESNSPTLNHFNDLLLRALHQSGHFFELKHDGIVPGVKQQMQQLGIRNIQTQSHIQSHHAGTPGAEDYYQSMQYVLQTFQPFFRKWINPSDDFNTLQRRAQEEMRQPDFATSWKLTTIWGTNPA
jgi:ubiquinone/menaquinone biosynthesis C-methylase UbiE